MKAKTASSRRRKPPGKVWRQDIPEPSPAFTARQRLHLNIARLQSLDQQLFWDSQKQADLLMTIELVGFKVCHLARQIQDSEQVESPSH